MPVISNATREIDRLLALRESGRRYYRDFITLAYEGSRQRILWNWHITFLADVMQAVAQRQLKRVIVNIPPRHLKSTIISQLWHAWMIGRDDSANTSLLSCGVAQALATRDSRRTLSVINSDWYKAAFPNVVLTRENEAEWETRGGSYRIAVGVGGTVTGRGAAHVTWDDILKADDAGSEIIREQTNEWLGETLATRLNDPREGTITGIMQRLHERDPTGYLLEQSKIPGADQYEHIVLPLEAPSRTTVEFNFKVYKEREAGELLHPERIGPVERDALKAAMRNNYDGQYLQNPVKMEGGMLDPRKIVRMDDSATHLQERFGLRPNFYIDFATREKQTQKDDPDFCVIAVVARDQMLRVFLLDLFRKQCDLATLANTLIAMHIAWKPRFVKGEKGGLLNTFQPMLVQRQRALGTFFPLFPLDAPLQDKVERSMPLQGLLHAGMVYAPKQASWLDNLEREMRGFPNGAHDDQVDALAYAALDVEDIKLGETQVTHPDDPAIQLDLEMKERIGKAVEREMARTYGSTDSDPEDW